MAARPSPALYARALARALTLAWLSVAGLVQAVLAVVILILSIAFGFAFFFPVTRTVVRRGAERARDRVARWSGMRIPSPYLPPPPPPVPQPDGMYRVGRTLYKTPRVPARIDRQMWMFSDPATWRDVAWRLLDPFVAAAFGVLPLLVIGYGLAVGWLWTPLAAPLGIAVAVATLAVLPWLIRAYTLWTRQILSPADRSLLDRRLRQLVRSRREAIDSQAAELRRIERELHDGAQARLVAVGMTIGAAEQLLDTDPSAAVALIDKAQEASAAALEELRRLVRGIRPPVLVERGLVEALRALAVESPLAVTVTHSGVGRCHSAVESAVYFAVTELLTNAVRHGRARRARVELRRDGDEMVVTVTDDGVGGADPGKGSGLRGIERRLMPFDGELELDSPPGGPTTVTLRLTCTPPESGEDGGASAGERRADRDFATDAAQAAPDSPRSPAASASRAKAAPSWRHDVSNLCWGLFAVPLVPLGLIPAALNAAGVPVPLPGWAIIALIVIGGQMLVYALVMLMQSVKERDSESADESRHR